VSFGLRLLLALGITSGALLACNAIVGVEDVRLRVVKGAPTDDGGEVATGGEDAGPILSGTDRGELAMGELHVCARLTTGAVKCWGDNGAGQLGDGLSFDAGTRVDPAKVPQTVPALDTVVSIAAGSKHTCAAKKDGTVVCWGSDGVNQLGDGITREAKPTAARLVCED